LVEAFIIFTWDLRSAQAVPLAGTRITQTVFGDHKGNPQILSIFFGRREEGAAAAARDCSDLASEKIDLPARFDKLF
jgi:hypothetical protein